jgi:hypothetical protein
VLTLPSSERIYVATEPVELRRGFDGLAAAARSVIRADPLARQRCVKTLLTCKSGHPPAAVLQTCSTIARQRCVKTLLTCKSGHPPAAVLQTCSTMYPSDQSMFSPARR